MKKTFILLSGLVFLLNCSPNQRNVDILIEGVNIINVADSVVIENQSIAVSADVIVDVFETGTKTYEAGSQIVATGKYALPGLWDMHVHFRGGDTLEAYNKKMLPLYIANGVTGVRDGGGDLTLQLISWKYLASSRFIIGPRLYYPGPNLDGPNAKWEGSLELSNASDVSAAFDSLDRYNSDYVKIFDSSLDADTFMEILRQSEENNLKATGHIPFSVYMDDAIDAGLDGVEHLYYVLKACSSNEKEITEAVSNGEMDFWSAVEVALNTYDEEKATKLFQKMAANNVYVTPTLYIEETLANITEVNHRQDKFLRYLSKRIIETYDEEVNSAQNMTEKHKQLRKDLVEHFEMMVLDMHNNGVKILSGSDAGAYNAYVYPGPGLHDELQKLSEAGISNIDVLRINLLNSIEFLDESANFGSIEKGKVADLLITNTNPLEDISNLEDIFGVNFGSAHFTKGFLDNLLERVRRPSFIGI